jgi:MarR family transcriptional regulator, repressor for mepA
MDEIEQLDTAISTLLRVLTIDERRLTTNLGSAPFNPIDLETLSFLHRHPGSLAKDAANYLGVRSTTMQSIVDRLHKRGLLQRDKTALKGRAVALSLTDEGMKFRQERQAQNLKNCEQILASLPTKDQSSFIKNMTTIAAAFS